MHLEHAFCGDFQKFSACEPGTHKAQSPLNGLFLPMSMLAIRGGTLTLSAQRNAQTLSRQQRERIRTDSVCIHYRVLLQ